MYAESEDSKPSKHGSYSAKARRNAKRALRQRADSMTYGEYSLIRGCKAKLRFPDEITAIHAAIGHSVKHGPCRHYLCPYCEGYHLTSHVEDLSACEEKRAS